MGWLVVGTQQALRHFLGNIPKPPSTSSPPVPLCSFSLLHAYAYLLGTFLFLLSLRKGQKENKKDCTRALLDIPACTAFHHQHTCGTKQHTCTHCLHFARAFPSVQLWIGSFCPTGITAWLLSAAAHNFTLFALHQLLVSPTANASPRRAATCRNLPFYAALSPAWHLP